VEPAEDQVVRFPGVNNPRESHDTIEAREDTRLLLAIAEADQRSLATLYRRRNVLLYSLVFRMLSNEMEAQEVIQDTFIQIWRRSREFEPGRSPPLSWMIMIARGLALDRLRSRSRRTANLAAYEQEVASLELEHVTGTPQTERDELAVICAAALHHLPESQGRAIQLAFFRGWTHEEIASAESQPLGTVKARIRRGLLALRKVLKEYHD
jgi:RNA polymerase sigma-70 factor (ECF subfamily)